MFNARRFVNGSMVVKTNTEAETKMLIHLIIKGANCINGGSTNILAMAAADCVTESRDSALFPDASNDNARALFAESLEKIAQLERELFLARTVIENVRNMTINCVGDIDNAEVSNKHPTC